MDPNNTQPGVQFDEEQRINVSYSSETPKMVGWAMKYSGGLVKNESQANYVLIGVAICAVVLTIIIVTSSVGNSSSPGRYVIPPGEVPGRLL